MTVRSSCWETCPKRRSNPGEKIQSCSDSSNLYCIQHYCPKLCIYMCNCILELPAAGRLWSKIAVKKFVAAFCNPIQSYWTRLDGPSKLTAVCLMDFSRSPIKMKAFKHKTYSNIESFEVPFLYYVDRKFVSKKTSQLWGALTVPQGSFFSHRLRALRSLKKGGGLLSHQQGAKVCQHLAICHSQPLIFYMAKENR